MTSASYQPTSTPGQVSPAPKLKRGERKSYRRHVTESELPPVTCANVLVERGIMITMRDGVRLCADHWYPAEGAQGPAILVRTPYGQAGNTTLAVIWAERGRHVVVQRCRGTFDSEGEFNPLHHELADGVDTVAWLRAQPWCPEAIHTWGPSYLGYTQWALAGVAGQDAAIIAQSARSFDSATAYVGGGFAMETALVWLQALEVQERGLLARLMAIARLRRKTDKAALKLPAATADMAAVGHRVDYYRDWLEHRAPGDPWWEPLRFSQDPTQVPPLILVAGWQDMFLPDQLADYAVMRDAGRPVRLIVGDWTHHSPGAGLTTVAESFRLPARPGDPLEGPRVRYEIAGGGGWRECESWPPPAAEVLTFQLSPVAGTTSGRLTKTAPPDTELTYRYDPADPTPQAGGRSLNPFTCGRRDQRARETREDVLLFTGAPLPADMLIAGTGVFHAEFSSTNPTVDLMVRLTDVDERGVSRTVTDGYVRLTPDGTAPGERLSYELRLDPVAYRFAAGHRIRFQVSSGAHPLHLRNPGVPDPLVATTLVPSQQRLFLGATGCRLELPLLS
ncbi:MAG: CocE/NonD family hydrolase [Propionibacteriaceae bacterium]|jgi:putative CocE/NonD family hydrolase|nr:CocE/NonD family hydrolase [Propionibacteriaceae bacterium]